MVGSEVDHKYLGYFAKLTGTLDAGLSDGLYRLLGLSTLLSRKLLRARKQRKLDPTRTTKSLDLYRHIIWMAREGLAIVQAAVLPVLADRHLRAVPALAALHVLALKLHASFLHIFVLFDYMYGTRSKLLPTPPPPKLQPTTDGLAAYAYIAPTIDAFNRADAAANRLLSGSHPLRLSVKLEFSAFTYDCTRDYHTSRAIAKRAVDEAFKDMSKMDDEAFEDAMELVGTLAIMAKRGLSVNPQAPSSSSPPPPPPPNPAVAADSRSSSWDVNDDGTITVTTTTATTATPAPYTNGSGIGVANGNGNGNGVGIGIANGNGSGNADNGRARTDTDAEDARTYANAHHPPANGHAYANDRTGSRPQYQQQYQQQQRQASGHHHQKQHNQQKQQQQQQQQQANGKTSGHSNHHHHHHQKTNGYQANGHQTNGYTNSSKHNQQNQQNQQHHRANGLANGSANGRVV